MKGVPYFLDNMDEADGVIITLKRANKDWDVIYEEYFKSTGVKTGKDVIRRRYPIRHLCKSDLSFLKLIVVTI